MNPEFLREAVRLSIAAIQGNEGGPFGAVVVRDGHIVGRGWNRVTSTNDPTAHAEVMAIRDACGHAKSFSLVGCEIYCSCEPCPMCLAAIYWSRMDRIYYAASCGDARQPDLTTGSSTVSWPSLRTSVPFRWRRLCAMRPAWF